MLCCSPRGWSELLILARWAFSIRNIQHSILTTSDCSSIEQIDIFLLLRITNSNFNIPATAARNGCRRGALGAFADDPCISPRARSVTALRVHSRNTGAAQPQHEREGRTHKMRCPLEFSAMRRKTRLSVFCHGSIQVLPTLYGRPQYSLTSPNAASKPE